MRKRERRKRSSTGRGHSPEAKDRRRPSKERKHWAGVEMDNTSTRCDMGLRSTVAITLVHISLLLVATFCV